MHRYMYNKSDFCIYKIKTDGVTATCLSLLFIYFHFISLTHSKPFYVYFSPLEVFESLKKKIVLFIVIYLAISKFRRCAKETGINQWKWMNPRWSNAQLNIWLQVYIHMHWRNGINVFCRLISAQKYFFLSVNPSFIAFFYLADALISRNVNHISFHCTDYKWNLVRG